MAIWHSKVVFAAALAVALSGGLTAASAQTLQAEPEYTIKLRQSQVNTLITGMTKVPMPYEQTSPLLQDVARQVDEQNKANAEKVAAVKAEQESALKAKAEVDKAKDK